MKRSCVSLLGVIVGLVAGCTGQPELSLGESTAAVSGLPRPDHIVIVWMENTGYSSIIGSASAPYINSMAAIGASFTDSHGVTHPSQPNYLAFFSGGLNGVSDDTCPAPGSPFTGVENLGSQLVAAGFSFTGFSEDLAVAGSSACTAGSINGYARKHAPWTDFPNVPASAQQPWKITPPVTTGGWPTDYTTLPTVSFVVPNLCDDIHSCSISTGDTWLKNNLDAFQQWAQTHNSLFIIDFDEDNMTAADHIPTIFVGPMVKHGTYPETIDHYSVLRTIEDMYGLTPLQNAATATPITDVWMTGAGGGGGGGGGGSGGGGGGGGSGGTGGTGGGGAGGSGGGGGTGGSGGGGGDGTGGVGTGGNGGSGGNPSTGGHGCSISGTPNFGTTLLVAIALLTLAIRRRQRFDA
jgi:hypothetical protein